MVVVYFLFFCFTSLLGSEQLQLNFSSLPDILSLQISWIYQSFYYFSLLCPTTTARAFCVAVFRVKLLLPRFFIIFPSIYYMRPTHLKLLTHNIFFDTGLLYNFFRSMFSLLLYSPVIKFHIIPYIFLNTFLSKHNNRFSSLLVFNHF